MRMASVAGGIRSIVSALLAVCAFDALGDPAGAADHLDADSNVMILDPSQADIEQRVDAVFRRQERAQFGTGRFAFLFKPGHYRLNVEVGFYTQVAGLGRLPGDVTIEGAVRTDASWMRRNATCNFWRSVENLTVAPRRDGGAMMWAVSLGGKGVIHHVINDSGGPSDSRSNVARVTDFPQEGQTRPGGP